MVFGQVTEGAEHVKVIEAVGTGSGATKASVVIVDCGEIKGKAT